MRATVVKVPGGPEVVTVSDDAERPEPSEREVLVEVAACGLCGHDQSDRLGLTTVDMPVCLGHEVAGRIAAVGNKVQHFDVGDRVASKQYSTCGWCAACRRGDELRCPNKQFNYGGLSELVALPEGALLAVPEHISLPQAAVVACAVGSPLEALRSIGRVVAGETVVVTGAGGGLGMHGVQVASALGARVIAVTSSEAKMDSLAMADEVVLARGDYWRELQRLTSDEGADVVLDNVGHPDVFKQCFRGLARRGRYILTGQVAGMPITVHPKFIFAKEAVVTGSASTSMATFIDAMRLVADGLIHPVVTRYPLDDVQRAFKDMDDRVVPGRIVVCPGDTEAAG
jgi:D-arabinose 1-dehydrogenase-like Zn-dependent alcohol dehydrogenase